MFVMAALRPDYSHLHDAISELGAVGAPRLWLWNIAGYIVPGLMLAVFGWRFVRRLRPNSRLVAAILAAGGLGLALAGAFPADMDNRQGAQTLAHMAGVLLSLAGWVVGLATICVWTMRSDRAVAFTCLAALAATAAGFSLYWLAPGTPALVQRICFAIFFAWYLAAAVMAPPAR